MPPRVATVAAPVESQPGSTAAAVPRKPQRRRVKHKSSTHVVAAEDTRAAPATMVDVPLVQTPTVSLRRKVDTRTSHAAASLGHLRALSRPVTDSPPPAAQSALVLTSATAESVAPAWRGDALRALTAELPEQLLCGAADDEERPVSRCVRSKAPYAISFDPRDAEDEEAMSAPRYGYALQYVPDAEPDDVPAQPSTVDAATPTVVQLAQRRLKMMRLRAAQVPAQGCAAPATPPIAELQRQARWRMYVGRKSADSVERARPDEAATRAVSSPTRSRSSASTNAVQRSRKTVKLTTPAAPASRPTRRNTKLDEVARQAFLPPSAVTTSGVGETRDASVTPPVPPDATAAAAPELVAAATKTPPEATPGRARRKAKVSASDATPAAETTEDVPHDTVAVSPSLQHFVFDTSSLLHSDPGVLNLLKEKSVICIPFTVIDELDKLNKGRGGGGKKKAEMSEQELAEREWCKKRAREVRNWVTAGLKLKDGMMRLQKREEVVDAYTRNSRNNDDSILGFAVYLVRKQFNTLFVSEDKFLRIKAESELGKAYSYADIKKMLRVCH